jgi:hypothetical protein
MDSPRPCFSTSLLCFLSPIMNFFSHRNELQPAALSSRPLSISLSWLCHIKSQAKSLIGEVSKHACPGVTLAGTYLCLCDTGQLHKPQFILSSPNLVIMLIVFIL